jgi:predicted transcriptional regulator
MLQGRVKELEKLRDKLEKQLKKDLRDKEKFFAGQIDLLSKIKVDDVEQPKIQDQINTIREQSQQESADITRAAETEISSVYAKINLLTEFIADGYELTKK